MPFEYVQNYYGVPAVIGRRVRCCGKPGTIVADRGHYIGVNLDSEKPSRITNYHPVDGVEYLDEITTPRKPSRGALRYQRYLEYGDMFESFIQFCRWDAQPERSWNAC